MRVILAAGGTGGHIFPALAVGEALQTSFQAEVIFVGTGKELERKLVNQAGYQLEEIPFVPVSGGGMKGILRFFRALPRALRQALQLLKNRQADVVIGFGGYPSFMPVFAAWLLRIPIIIHEQNVQVGLANKILTLLSTRVFSTFGAEGFFALAPKAKMVGNPVRKQFFEISDWQKPQPGERFKILVIGGSQGAVSLNNAVLECSEFFQTEGIELLHQTGEKDFERVAERYRAQGFHQAKVTAFINDIPKEYSEAHLIISRAGALSASEIAACGRPAIFVPLVIARAHQKRNVEHLAQIGAAIVLEQNELTGKNLQVAVKELLREPEKLAAMAERAKETALSEGKSAALELAEAASQLARA